MYGKSKLYAEVQVDRDSQKEQKKLCPCDGAVSCSVLCAGCELYAEVRSGP